MRERDRKLNAAVQQLNVAFRVWHQQVFMGTISKSQTISE